MKLRGDRIQGRSGTLCQRTKQKKLKSGEIKEYPLVSGNRDPQNIDHWFWNLTYKEKDEDGKYRTHTASVRAQQVEAVKVLILGNVELEVILAYLKSSK
jgi:hypothetical protein